MNSKRSKARCKVAASLTVYKASEMTDKGRKTVCDWLRKQLRYVQREPKSLGPVFRARYLYEVGK